MAFCAWAAAVDKSTNSSLEADQKAHKNHYVKVEVHQNGTMPTLVNTVFLQPGFCYKSEKAEILMITSETYGTNDESWSIFYKFNHLNCSGDATEVERIVLDQKQGPKYFPYDHEPYFFKIGRPAILEKGLKNLQLAVDFLNNYIIKQQ